jgi:hypothetical protein
MVRMYRSGARFQKLGPQDPDGRIFQHGEYMKVDSNKLPLAPLIHGGPNVRVIVTVNAALDAIGAAATR